MKPIYISRTYLPPFEDYVNQIKTIWKDNWLTNNGKLVQKLEKKLQKRLDVKHVVCVANGTLALMIAVKALGIKDKIYTSPYTFVASLAGLVWDGIKPEFVDLDEGYLGPALVTHVYGIPQKTTARPVIYDASHAFAVKEKGKSILSWGDISIVSFNAVKIFQTAEGGAIVTNNDQLAKKARYMRNYGYKTRYSFHRDGLNAKMSEFHAAMGLCSLKLVDKMVKKYSQIIESYNKALGYDHKGVTYYPIWYSSEAKLLRAIKEFEKNKIFPRRYFYPPLNWVYGGKACPIAEDKMRRVLCLPLYYEFSEKDQDRVIKIAQKTL